MSEITRRAQFPLLPELAELLDPFHVLTGGRVAPDAYGISIETRFEDGAYKVRAELPGIDPGKDVEVTVTDGLLTIHAERSETHEGRGHSEFRYGTFTRTLRLPEGAKQEEVTAEYKGGIMTITVPVEKEAKPATHKVTVKMTD
ncbi:Hsp20/alpha crystallin family protein [Actinocrinis puniceicyclus]|uniref:Hsp20/alpha crystallin family protein n=1 Tax=Actinocrinis puniceicyclus TaxID=977794 RepID=A0A8J7WMB8_9ACTN|nr:Hsp20/alpha crystallin family protein [Actinocrinis puniceicyclus]MBS2965036.1 Hsp20/alpha crystallin family protein [Actinocrinis puniceicyclus]